MAVDISRSPPVFTSAFQQACSTAANSTRETMTAGEVMGREGKRLGAVTGALFPTPASGGVGAARQALRDQVMRSDGKCKQHAMQPPGIGRMNHHVPAPVIKAGGVFARGEPAHDLAR